MATVCVNDGHFVERSGNAITMGIRKKKTERKENKRKRRKRQRTTVKI